MKKILFYFISCLLIYLAITEILIPQLNIKTAERYKSRMIKALNLKLVYSSELYRHQFLHIFNDTIVGYKTSEDRDSTYFFIQGLKGSKYVKKVKINLSPLPLQIDDYNNGCLYFTGPSNGGVMRKVCSNGSITSYYNGYKGEKLAANKILTYHFRAVFTYWVHAFVFDTISKKVVWRFDHDVDNGLSSIVGNKWIFTYKIEHSSTDVRTFIRCVDLDNLNTLWEKTIKGYTYGIVEIGHLYSEVVHSSSQLFIDSQDGLLVLDVNTGVTQRHYKEGGGPIVDNSHLYFDNHRSLWCVDLKTYQKMWQADKLDFVSLNKGNIIAQTPDHKEFVIIDKLTGRIKDKIPVPFKYQADAGTIFLGDYILFDRKNLYN